MLRKRHHTGLMLRKVHHTSLMFLKRHHTGLMLWKRHHSGLMLPKKTSHWSDVDKYDITLEWCCQNYITLEWCWRNDITLVWCDSLTKSPSFFNRIRWNHGHLYELMSILRFLEKNWVHSPKLQIEGPMGYHWSIISSNRPLGDIMLQFYQRSPFNLQFATQSKNKYYFFSVFQK